MDAFSKIAEHIKHDTHVAILTGAGISAESGIPTFRDKDGIWTKMDPNQLASFDVFLRDPVLVSHWYQHRRKVAEEHKPNAGHLALAELEKFCKSVTVVTQNIDRYHQKAGSKNVIELHGNIEENYCIRCKKFQEIPELKDNDVPKCKYCGDLVRPNVVWFGEMLPQDAIRKASETARNCDVFFSVGTSTVVFPAAQFPLDAKNSGAVLIEINPEETMLTPYCHYSVREKSSVALTQLLEILKKKIEK